MYNHILYLSYWFVNSLIFWIASKLFSRSITLGTWRFSSLEAAVYAGFWLTFFIWAMWDFILVRGVKSERGVGSSLYFWCTNTFGIWLVARFAYLTGLGISSFFWAIFLGLVTWVFQKMAWRFVVKPK